MRCMGIVEWQKAGKRGGDDSIKEFIFTHFMEKDVCRGLYTELFMLLSLSCFPTSGHSVHLTRFSMPFILLVYIILYIIECYQVDNI